MSPADLISALEWRYATKAFDASRKIPADTWAALEQSLVLTPSSFGLQPWKFIVITDAALREKIVPHAWNQRQVADASHLVVMAVKKNITSADLDAFINRMIEVRGGTPEALAGYRKMLDGSHSQGYMSEDWAKKQAYIALGQFMAACAMLRIDTCPMEGMDEVRVKKIIGLGDNPDAIVTMVISAGRRAPGGVYGPRLRLPRERFLHTV